MSGNKITGDLADKYVLIKQQPTAASAATASVENAKTGLQLEETRWVLKEVMAKLLSLRKKAERSIYIF